MQPGHVPTLGWMPVIATTAPAATGTGAFSLMLLLLVAIVVPVAAIAFSRSGRRLNELGKGRFAVDFDRGDGDDEREDELRQLVEARAWRRRSRGESPEDVEAEVERLLALDPDRNPADAVTGPGTEPPCGPLSPAPGRDGTADPPETDPALREEIRQVVVAKNESRRRRGQRPLDVEAEIDRLMAGMD